MRTPVAGDFLIAYHSDDGPEGSTFVFKVKRVHNNPKPQIGPGGACLLKTSIPGAADCEYAYNIMQDGTIYIGNLYIVSHVLTQFEYSVLRATP